jgi:hypothetical protein
MPETLYKLAFDKLRIVLKAGQKWWETLYTFENNNLRAGRLVVYVGEKSNEAKIGIVLAIEKGPRLAKVRVIPGQHDSYPHKEFQSVDYGDILCWLKVYSGKPETMYRLYIEYPGVTGFTKQQSIRVDTERSVLEQLKKDCEENARNAGNENRYSYHIEQLKGESDV